VIEPPFLGIPGIDSWIFAGLTLAALVTAFVGVVTGAAGGLVLLLTMAFVFPPATLIPLHTIVQLGAGSSRVIIMWRHIMKELLPPFAIGAVVGAAIGAQIFVALPTAVLQATMGLFILVIAWLPRFGRVGPQKRRFALLGAGITFLGMFVSATGSLLAPFVASASPDRRQVVATMATLMAVGHLMKLVAFTLLGIALAAYTPLLAAMIAAAALGTWLGSRALNFMPEKLFRIVFQIILTALAGRLIWIGVRDSAIF
jgi:uncharacterized membrane protein YfcA